MLIVGSNFQHVSSTSQWLYGKTSWNISKLHLKFIVVRHIGILLLPEQSVVITTAQMTTHLSAWQTRPSNVHMSCMRDTSGSFVSCFSHEAANVPCWPLWSQQDFNGPGHPGEQQKGEKTNRTKQYKIQNRMPAMTGVMARGKWYSWRWHKCWWRIYNNGRAMSCFAFPTVLSKSFRYHGCSSTFLSVKLTQKIKPHFQLYKFHPEPPDMMSNKKMISFSQLAASHLGATLSMWTDWKLDGPMTPSYQSSAFHLSPGGLVGQMMLGIVMLSCACPASRFHLQPVCSKMCSILVSLL